MWTIPAVGLLNSIMFPAIFTLGISGTWAPHWRRLRNSEYGDSGRRNRSLVGWQTRGLDQSQLLSDDVAKGETSWGQGIHYALIVATHLLFVAILSFAVSGSKPNSERHAKVCSAPMDILQPQTDTKSSRAH